MDVCICRINKVIQAILILILNLLQLNGKKLKGEVLLLREVNKQIVKTDSLV